MGILCSWVFIIFCVMVYVLFFTLLERKILSYMQNRKGPKKVSLMGWLQPIADAGKLLCKENSILLSSNSWSFFFSPLFSVVVMLCSLFYISLFCSTSSIQLSFIFFVCFSSLQVYTLLGSGWGSKSKYALIGSLRGLIQVISYEISLLFLIFFPCCLKESYNLLDFYYKSYLFFLKKMPLFFMWLFMCVAETKRAPLDFAEGESELVSGFKVEFGSMGFAFLFLAEYGKILIMGLLTVVIFLVNKFTVVGLFAKSMSFAFIWMRASFPRFRIDFLMNVAWKIFLPLSLFFLMFFLVLTI